MDVELALKINKLIHDECKDVPHDIGLRVSELVENHQAEQLILSETTQLRKRLLDFAEKWNQFYNVTEINEAVVDEYLKGNL
jgi:hypothetical protein